MWIAVAAEEQAVSMARLGPRSPRVKDSRLATMEGAIADTSSRWSEVGSNTVIKYEMAENSTTTIITNVKRWGNQITVKRHGTQRIVGKKERGSIGMRGGGSSQNKSLNKQNRLQIPVEQRTCS